MAKRGRKPRRIAFAGIELEGAWSERPNGLKGDGSLSFDSEEREEAPYVGELVSDPLPPSRVKRWILANHPTRVNPSCGLHVHVSTRSALDYGRLMAEDGERFSGFVISEITRWARRVRIHRKSALWSRLRGENTYCKLGTCARDGVRGSGDRYHAVNFCAYPRHGTVEIRVLSAFKDKRYAASAVHNLLRVIERYLGTFPETENEPREVFVNAMEAPEPQPVILENCLYADENVQSETVLVDSSPITSDQLPNDFYDHV